MRSVTLTVTSAPAWHLSAERGARPRRVPAADPGAVALRVALLGCGTVGSEVARLLIEQAADLQARVGRPLELVGIAVRRLEPGRGPASTRRCSPPTPRPWSPATTSTW